ncbi:MAG TPA: IPT/TIG domain-containing protein, partial [Thermoanaerobaculia bacterium]
MTFLRRIVPIFLLVASATIARAQTAPVEGRVMMLGNVSLRPSTGNAGTTLDVQIRGYLADPTALSIAFQPAGFLTVRNIRLQAREIIFTLDISPNAPARAYTLVLTPTAPVGEARIVPPPLTLPDAFRVRRPVRVTSVNPAQLAPGTSANVTITGSGFQSKAKLFFPGTSGVTATVTNVTATSIAATFTADPNAAPGARPFVVQNPDGSDNADQAPLPSIMVAQPAATPVPPVVNAITPASAAQGASLLVRIAGSNFQKGATVNLGTGITAQVATVTPAEIIANVAVAPNATPGAHRVIVRNPDGLTNDAQPRPVELTITAPVAKPPETKPPATTPPVTTPPVTTPPVTTPPVTTPPVTKPPVTTPPTTPPVTTPPVTPTLPPVTTPPTTAPPVTKLPVPPLLPPAQATLQGPRVDSVKPQSLTPGQTYMLQLDGKNFSPQTKIALGKDITVVGVPVVLSPTKANLQVIVSPAAKAGVVPAVASNGKEQNSGPGGVMIASAQGKNNTPGSKAPAAPATPVEAVKQVLGSIALIKPCTPYENYSCNDVPLLNDSVNFTWKELTPGVSQLFVFEIIDAKQNLLYSAQTQAPHLEWSASKLSSVFDKIASKPHGTSPYGSDTRSSTKSGANASGVVLAGSTPGSQQGVPHAQKLSDTELVLKAYPSSIFWRVRGMRKKAGKQNDLYVAAESEIRPLDLPKPPGGFSCPAGSKSKIAIVPVPSAEPFAAPCDKKNGKYSTNLCSGMTARFSEDSVVDLTNIPFQFGQLGSVGEGGNMVVAFIGLFVDWGDGTEPQPLVVAGDESPSLAKAKIYTAGLKHVYKNKSNSDEKHEYFARIYAVSSDSTVSLAAVGKEAAKAATSGAQGNKMVHTVACTTVKVFNEVDATKDGPLTLVSALTVFPEDWSKLAALAQVSVGGNGAGAGLIGGSIESIPLVDIAASAGGSRGSGGNRSGGIPSGTVDAGTTIGTPVAGSGATAVSTQVAKIDTSQVTSVSECAEAFRPFVRIRYYGHGRARVRWTLDGKIIDEHETPELPPVSYSDAMGHKKSYDVDLSIPLPAKLGKGMNLHTLKVHVETGALPGSMTSATTTASASKNSGAAGMTLGDAKHVASTVPSATGGGPSLASSGPNALPG